MQLRVFRPIVGLGKQSMFVFLRTRQNDLRLADLALQLPRGLASVCSRFRLPSNRLDVCREMTPSSVLPTPSPFLAFLLCATPHPRSLRDHPVGPSFPLPHMTLRDTPRDSNNHFDSLIFTLRSLAVDYRAW